MKHTLRYILPLVIVFLWTCNRNEKMDTKNQSETVFPKGEKVMNDNFIGTVWLNYLAQTDSVHNVNIGSVRFEPGARTNWHYHKGGQILLVTEGKGLYQERGKPIETIDKGDVVKCPPNIEHWHGRSEERRVGKECKSRWTE